ncbi:hypothetical protein BKI52_25270 [marine bacterium AO1-C]|nr:hypothetical protein BKI52_25270 [marine bacterium AO1-C]
MSYTIPVLKKCGYLGNKAAYFCFCWVIFLSNYTTFAQKQAQIDSLSKVFKSNISDKEKVNVCLKLARIYLEIDSLATVQYADQAVQLANQINDKKGAINAFYLLGKLNTRKGNYARAKMFQQQVIEQSKTINYLVGQAKGLSELGSINDEEGVYEKALDYCLQALKINQKLDNQEKIADNYNLIAIVYANLGNEDKAIDYFNQSFSIKQQLEDKKGMAITLGNIGTLLSNQEKYQEALKYHQRSLILEKEIDNQVGIALSYRSIGDTYLYLKQYERVLDYYSKSLKIIKTIGASVYEPQVLFSIGTLQAEQNQWKVAKQYFLDAMKIAKKMKLIRLMKDTAEQLALVQKNLGNYEAAYEAQVLFKKMADSLRNDEVTQNVTRLVAEYEFQQEKDSIKFANKAQRIALEKDIENRKVTQQATLIGIGLLALLALILFLFFQSKRRSNKLLTEKSKELETANGELQAANKEIQTMNKKLSKTLDTVEHQRDDILSSIRYAKRIQNSILPRENYCNHVLPTHFIFFKPRDVVSGDFYWLSKINQKVILAVADCTGHGVPGAFMSMVGNDLLNNIVKDKKVDQPHLILNQLHKEVRQALHQDETNNRDGMDITLVSIDTTNKKLEFAGAKNPLIYVQNGQLNQIKGDQMSIGGEQLEGERIFTPHEIDITPPTTFYLFSDGFQDQFGGPKGRKFLTHRFRELLFEIHDQEMAAQHTTLEQTLNDWMNYKEQQLGQIDDILVVGVKVE